MSLTVNFVWEDPAFDRIEGVQVRTIPQPGDLVAIRDNSTEYDRVVRVAHIFGGASAHEINIIVEPEPSGTA